MLVVGLHLYLVLYHGISEPPKSGHPVDPNTYQKEYKTLLAKDGVNFWPDAAWRDALFGSLMISIIVALAFTIGPPQLSKPPDPTQLNAYPRPDWYLLWYFAVLALVPAKIESYIIILAPLLIFGSMFAIPFLWNKGERSPWRRPWAIAWVIIVVTGVCTLWYEGEWRPGHPTLKLNHCRSRCMRRLDSAAHHGAVLFYDKGCEFCHQVEGHGGLRGPDLSDVANRLTSEQMEIGSLTGGHNMPAFAGILRSEQLDDLIAFLRSRRTASGPLPVHSGAKLDAETSNNTVNSGTAVTSSTPMCATLHHLPASDPRP